MKRLKLFASTLLLLFSVSSSYAEAVFKEPVLLWEREFSPAIRDLSDQNTDGDFLAIQMDKMGIRGEKLLVLDNKGKTKREELLPKRKKRSIPAEQLWLTATGDEELEQLKKTKKPKMIDSWGENIFISGNGEYYAVVTRGIGAWFEFEYKDKNGKTLFKIYPKDNYGFVNAYISYDGSRIIIIDEGGHSGGDVWEVTGQRVYFYDNTGRLIKDYDYKDRMNKWIKNGILNYSPNYKYVACFNNEGMLQLYDLNGVKLYHKKYDINSIIHLADSGELILDREDNFLLIDRSGDLKWEMSWKGPERGSVILSPGGDKVIVTSKYSLYIIKSDDREQLNEININSFNNLIRDFTTSLGSGFNNLDMLVLSSLNRKDKIDYIYIANSSAQIKWKKEFKIIEPPGAVATTSHNDDLLKLFLGTKLGNKFYIYLIK